MDARESKAVDVENDRNQRAESGLLRRGEKLRSEEKTGSDKTWQRNGKVPQTKIWAKHRLVERVLAAGQRTQKKQ